MDKRPGQEPNGPNPAKTGVANFTTTVTTADGSKYVSNFSVVEPVCNPGNKAKPSNVFQLKGDVTLTYTPAGGSPTSIPGAAYSAGR
ncbi:hypothetical protein ACFZB9_22965 [Kitasatospora sp. NPDC008050]|uniref:hypothetical protein n=1 Tax=Kitasatospora sp. NPDC008050 TaxID=3364021 RepID=UPI0036EDF21D